MRDDPTDLRGMEDEKREADLRDKMARKEEIADIRWLMSSRQGRRILWRLLESAGPFRPSFDQNAMRMAFNEGKRHLGTDLFNEVMAHCPEMYPVMLKEQQDDRDGTGSKSK